MNNTTTHVGAHPCPLDDGRASAISYWLDIKFAWGLGPVGRYDTSSLLRNAANYI